MNKKDKLCLKKNTLFLFTLKKMQASSNKQGCWAQFFSVGGATFRTKNFEPTHPPLLGWHKNIKKTLN